jgi:hypothetical protein
MFGDFSISVSVDAAVGGFDGRLAAFAALLRFRPADDPDLSLRTSVLSSLNSFFSILIFLSFFDIPLHSSALVYEVAQMRFSSVNTTNSMAGT